MSLFTPAELEKLRRADEAIERGFHLTNEELAESRERDRESVLDQMDGKTRRVAERNKAYYAANRERLAERRKVYYEANRERLAEYQKAYYEANQAKVAEYQKTYYEANRENLAVRWKGAALRRLRTLAGWSQYELARRSGVSQPMISLYETGAVPFDPSIFEPVLPGLSASLEGGPAITDKEVDT